MSESKNKKTIFEKSKKAAIRAKAPARKTEDGKYAPRKLSVGESFSLFLADTKASNSK